MSSRFILPLADVGNGISPSDGAKLTFFITGTSTLKDTFSDEGATTPNTNPVIADGDGVFPEIWITGRYKVRLTDKNDVQTWEEDPIIEGVNFSAAQLKFETIADMVANTAIELNQFILIEDYAAGNESGVLFFKVVAAGTGTADGGKFIDLPNTTPPLQVQANFPPNHLPAKHFGSAGDGITDDTTQIDNAWLISRATIAVTLSGEIAGELTTTLNIPPGDYIYTGTGLTIASGNVNIKADPNSVRIRLPDGIYFITATGAISNSNIVGINTYGGLGAVKYSFTGNNVTGKHKVTDCMFSNYTQCAIGNNSNDFPHMHIERCIFRCREGETAFGVAFGGFVDGLTIKECDFRKNKIHIKVGDRLSGNIYIEENDFINTGSQVRLADIWFVPNSTDPGGLASGQGTVVSKNKFGNEGMAVDDVRILLSVEAAGTDRLSKQPNLTFDTSAFITDVKFKDNVFNGVGNQTGPLIKSYVQHARGFIFKGNEMQGGDHTFLVDWDGALNDDELSSMWDIDLALASNPHVRIMPISNQPLGLVRDPFIQSGGDESTIQDFPTIGDDVSFSQLLAQQDPDVDGSLVNATKTGTTDSLGGGQAVEIDASTSTGRWVSAAMTDPVAGLPSFVEVDIKKASTNPVGEVEISIKHSVTNLFIVRRVVKCPTNWVRIRIPFTPQTNAGAANSYQLAVTVRGFVNGVTDRFEIGRLAVYQSKQAMNYGHIRTQGSGAFDQEHIIMGNFHLFMNGNDLRISIGAPSSASDGALIATAT